MRWGLFRLQESPRYLVARGREDEAVIALQAIATYNDRTMDIAPEDVQGGDAEQPAESVAMRDKKNSELPTPDPIFDGDDERSPLPDVGNRSSGADDSASGGSGLSRSGSRGSAPPRYDAVGMGPAPPKRREPIRTGSAFYAPAPGAENLEDGLATHLRNSLEEGDEEGEGLMNGDAERSSSGAKRRGWRSWGRDRNWMSWWDSWVRQISRLFVPQWRRTVILMWIIWGSMSFGALPDGVPSWLFRRWGGLTKLSIHHVQRLAACGPGEQGIWRRRRSYQAGLAGICPLLRWAQLCLNSDQAHELITSLVAGCPGSIVRRFQRMSMCVIQ